MSKFITEDGKLYGKYRAEVLKVDDPERRGRVLVKSESLMPDKPELGWAESCFMPGQFFLPRKGDYVWIEFENGEIDLPIWVGIMPTRDYVKNYLFSSYGDRTHYDPNIKIIRSANHQGVHLLDGAISGENEVKITDSSGSTIQLESKSTNIILSPVGTVVQ